MSGSFIKKIGDEAGVNVTDEYIAGYTEEELVNIEKIYDIEIKNDFRLFMAEMGKCDGGLIGDDPIILYREFWDFKTQVLFQKGFREMLQEDGFIQCLNKPFVFSWVSETQYFFLQTGKKDDIVYHYDENEEICSTTKYSFFEYMIMLVEELHNQESKIIASGSLLKT